MKPGDVIIEVNGKPVPSRDELVQTVMALKPGTTVPMKVLRDKQEKTLNVTIGELNLDAESQSARAKATSRPRTRSAGFGMTLGNLTADRARRLELPAGTTGALIIDVDPIGHGRPRGPAGRRRHPAGQPQEGGVGGRGAAASCRRSSRAARRSCSSGAGTRRSSSRLKKE